MALRLKLVETLDPSTRPDYGAMEMLRAAVEVWWASGKRLGGNEWSVDVSAETLLWFVHHPDLARLSGIADARELAKRLASTVERLGVDARFSIVVKDGNTWGLRAFVHDDTNAADYQLLPIRRGETYLSTQKGYVSLEHTWKIQSCNVASGR